MRSKQFKKTLRLCVMGIMMAMAYVVLLLIKIPLIPAAPFLVYEPKDVFLTLIALLLDPVAGLIAVCIVSFVELITISDTGLWGFFMNGMASCAFLLPISLLCFRKETKWRRILGGVLSVLCLTVVMLPLNYYITPLYMGVPREAVLELLCPAILPFNLIKGSINAVLVFLLYAPARSAFRAAKLSPSDNKTDKN